MNTKASPPLAAPNNSLRRFALLSVAAAVTTIGLKSAAYWLTGSVGLLSDALESLVNLAAALMALAMLGVAVRPPDEEHAYGHNKVEYFSSGIEGALILIAAASIAYTAINRLLHPQPLERIDLGLGISLAAALVNLAAARILIKAGREHRSITLEADGKHLLTDVWTSAGVLAGIGLAWWTGWMQIDAWVALFVAANIFGWGCS